MKKLVLINLFSLMCLVTFAQPWSNLPGGNIANSVEVMLADSINNKIYAAGVFSAAGGIPTQNIASYNGFAWDSIGGGLPLLNPIKALAIYNGNLYAGCYGGAAGEEPLHKLTGGVWSPVSNISSSLEMTQALCVYNGVLYGGGISRFYKWNDTTFTALGSLGSACAISAMAVYDGYLYIAYEDGSSGPCGSYIYKTDMMSCCSPMPNLNGSIRALKVFNGELYAAGKFTTAGGVPARYVAKWNGTTWSAVGSGIQGIHATYCDVMSLEVYKGELYAGGMFYDLCGGTACEADSVFKWNGINWKSVGTGYPHLLGQAMAQLNGDLYAGGWNGMGLATIKRWNNGEEVWPGDADDRSDVTNYDLLPIGMHYGQTGFMRDSISNIWQADSSANWGITNGNGDIKHVDCNGDGVIDNNDTLAISLNFSSTHAFAPEPVTEERLSGEAFTFSSSSSTYAPGTWVDVDVILGSATDSVENLYGIAFDISYVSSLVEPGTLSISYPASWLATPGTNAIKFSKIVPSANRVYGALTRINHSHVSGEGKIATLHFQISSSVSGITSFPLSVKNYVATDASGNFHALTRPTYTITIDPFSTGVSNILSTRTILVSPNPFKNQTLFQFETFIQDGELIVVDLLGKSQKQEKFSGREFILNREQLSNGVYLVKVFSKNSLIGVKKIVIE